MNVRQLNRVGMVALSLIAMLAVGCNGKQVKDTPKDSPYAEPALEFRGIGFEDQSFDGTSVVFFGSCGTHRISPMAFPPILRASSIRIHNEPSATSVHLSHKAPPSPADTGPRRRPSQPVAAT